jgi:hypothetical protein
MDNLTACRAVHIVSIVIEKPDDNPKEELQANITFGFCDNRSRFFLHVSLSEIDAWLRDIERTKPEHLIGRHFTAELYDGVAYKIKDIR